MNPTEIISAYSKLNTSAVSDAMDSLGIKDRTTGFKPRSANFRLVGFAYTIKYELLEPSATGFHNAGNYIDNVPADSVIVIDNNGFEWCTTWGGILTKVAEKRNLGGVVVNGAIRDIEEIQHSHLPIFSQHIFMCSGKNRVYKAQEQCTLTINNVTVVPGDLVMGDGNGIIFIPKDYIEECLVRARAIEKTEAKILKAVIQENIPLQVARSRYRYDQPWIEAEGS